MGTSEAVSTTNFEKNVVHWLLNYSPPRQRQGASQTLIGHARATHAGSYLFVLRFSSNQYLQNVVDRIAFHGWYRLP